MTKWGGIKLKCNLTGDEGWIGGNTVHMQEGRPTAVLGPDGEPVRYLLRHKAGFDLTPKVKRTALKEGEGDADA